jgi:hypothetical protein
LYAFGTAILATDAKQTHANDVLFTNFALNEVEAVRPVEVGGGPEGKILRKRVSKSVQERLLSLCGNLGLGTGPVLHMR